MKALLLLTTVASSGFTAAALAQGLVSWTGAAGFLVAETNSTVSSSFAPGVISPPPLSGSIGRTLGNNSANNASLGYQGYCYELLVSPEATSPPATLADLSLWFETGLSATNGPAANGRIVQTAAQGIAFNTAAIASNWPAGVTANIVLAGWSENLGATYSEVMLKLMNYVLVDDNSYFGVSSMGTLTSAVQSPGVPVFGSNPGQISNTALNPMQLDLLYVGLWIDLTVSIAPLSETVCAGSNAVLQAYVRGGQAVGYAWFCNGLAIANQDTSTLTITNAQAKDSGNYAVRVGLPNGSFASAYATITVVFPPSISLQPTNQTLAAGHNLTLQAAADGTTPLNYQWQNGRGPIPGQTNGSLVLNPAVTNYTDNYFLVVSNPYGTVTSQVATVFVYLPVNILSQPASRVVSYMGQAAFGVTADGFPSPTSYQWLFNGTNLPGATSNTLTIERACLENTGNYQVQVGNGYSSANSSIATLNMAPTLIAPFGGATTTWGRDATLIVGAYGSGQLTYQWYFNGTAIAGATLPSLSFSSIQFTNGGLYSVVVSSPYGSVTNVTEQVIVNPAGISLGFYPGLTISGSAGYSYIIQSSTDLADTNSWWTLTNLILTSPEQLWIDSSVDASSPFNPRVFYKILPGQ